MRKRPELHAAGQKDTPQAIAIPVDRLRLILLDHLKRLEDSVKWIGYSAVSFTMFGTVATGDYSFTDPKLGLNGGQWMLAFTIAGAYTAARAIQSAKARFDRPSLDDLMNDVLESSESFREARAIFLIKHRGQDHDFRILVYEDALWECYLMPHYNIEGLRLSDTDDPTLTNYVAAFIGSSAENLTVSYIPGCDLRSRKLSEFYRHDTQYRFAFYLVRLNVAPASDAALRRTSFVLSGRKCAWMTLSEMEDHENTRRRNLDVTRHIADNSYRLLEKNPDSLPEGVEITSGDSE